MFCIRSTGDVVANANDTCLICNGKKWNEVRTNTETDLANLFF